MADQNPSIKISSRADTGAILRTIGSVKGLRREIKGLSKDMLLNAAASKLMGSSMGGAGKQTDRWKKVLDSTDKIIQKMGAMTMKSLVSMLKVATMQMAALGAAMVVTHGAFIVGRFAMKLPCRDLPQRPLDLLRQFPSLPRQFASNRLLCTPTRPRPQKSLAAV
jgi:hypothetical protein